MSVSQRVEGGDWILFVADGFRCPSKDWMTIRFDEFSYFWDGLKTISQKTIWHLVTGHLRNLNWRYLPYIRPIKGLCKGISPQNMVLYGTVPPSQDPEVPIDLVSCPASIPMKERYHSTQTLADVHCIWVVFFPFPCLHALVKDVWSSNLSRYKLYEPEKSAKLYLLLDQRCNRFVISWCWWISSWKCACLSQPPEFCFYQETSRSIQILILLLELQERLAGRPHFQSVVWCSLAQSPGENLI